MPEDLNKVYPVRTRKTDSSNIAYCSYDEMLNNMTVYFLSGFKYDFFEVPKNLWSQLCDAPSPGRFFNRNIKDRFEYRKLGRWSEDELQDVIMEDYKKNKEML